MDRNTFETNRYYEWLENDHIGYEATEDDLMQEALDEIVFNDLEDELG